MSQTIEADPLKVKIATYLARGSQLPPSEVVTAIELFDREIVATIARNVRLRHDTLLSRLEAATSIEEVNHRLRGLAKRNCKGCHGRGRQQLVDTERRTYDVPCSCVLINQARQESNLRVIHHDGLA
jgi:hypothetical protein